MKRQGLSSEERIKSKKEFDLLYSSGKIIVSANQKFKAVYFFEKISIAEGKTGSNSKGGQFVKAAFAVHRKAGKAVWRNRVKRLLRVSYRLNKEQLINSCKEKNIFLLIVFSPYSVNSKNFKNINLKDVMPNIVELIKNIGGNL